MIRIVLAPRFVRVLKKLEPDVQEAFYEKATAFQSLEQHKVLHVHKLHGALQGCNSFSINYAWRVVFRWKDKKTAEFLAIGDHTVYR
jgi:plasmid maintenance system killer protein